MLVLQLLPQQQRLQPVLRQVASAAAGADASRPDAVRLCFTGLALASEEAGGFLAPLAASSLGHGSALDKRLCWL